MLSNIGKSYLNVLGDNIAFVRLEGTLPDPAQASMDDWIVRAARTSYRQTSKGTEKDRGLLRFLMEHGHESPAEHPHMTFSLRAPVMVLGHLRTHRVFHASAESARFKEPRDEVYVPGVWRSQSGLNKQGSGEPLDDETSREIRTKMRELVEGGFAAYKEAIARGVAREQARLLLPGYAIYQSYIMTADLRNFLHFVSLRAAPDAQLETRAFACAMFWLVQPHAPYTAELWLNTLKTGNPRTYTNLVEFYRQHGAPCDDLPDQS